MGEAALRMAPAALLRGGQPAHPASPLLPSGRWYVKKPSASGPEMPAGGTGKSMAQLRRNDCSTRAQGARRAAAQLAGEAHLECGRQ